MEYVILAASSATAFILCALATVLLLPLLKKKQFRQYERKEGPASHKKKSGTPTMGGIAIVLTLMFSALIFCGFSHQTVAMLMLTLFFGGTGFLDDFLKLVKKQNQGLREWQKLIFQVLSAFVAAWYIDSFCPVDRAVYMPFFDLYVDLGSLYIPFIMFVMLAMANSVNLTDGLDGLCAGVTAIASTFFIFAGLALSQLPAARYAAVICGACLGFLVFNRYPARLFMGDTGSMALGGALCSVALLTRMEFMLVIVGFIYVIETISVLIQMVSFQLFRKRVFKMAPIHHHFELCGMKETSVVRMFWAISAVTAITAWLIYR